MCAYCRCRNTLVQHSNRDLHIALKRLIAEVFQANLYALAFTSITCYFYNYRLYHNLLSPPSTRRLGTSMYAAGPGYIITVIISNIYTCESYQRVFVGFLSWPVALLTSLLVVIKELPGEGGKQGQSSEVV